jgi:hypothetical protein
LATADINWYIDRRLVHEFHTSERKSFRGCRRRWDWVFRQGYYPKMTPKPLDFGVAYHKAEEVYYDPDTWNWPREVVLETAIKAFKDKNNKQRTVAHDSLMFKTEEEVDEDFDEREKLGIGMLRYQHEVISPKEDQTWHPIKVEIEFMVPIPHPVTKEHMWCKCETCYTKWAKHQYLERGDVTGAQLNAEWQTSKGLPVVYAGRIDCLGEDDNGDLWIIDWKTAARIPDDHSFLDLDDQVGSYPWALWSIGMNVRGFIYHEQKKGYPLPPPENKVIRLGRKFSVKQDMDTDYETYLKTVSQQDARAHQDGLYDSYLTYLREYGQTFYHRAQIHHTEAMLLQTQENLGLEVLDMLAPDLRIYPNPGRFGCSNCAFQQPCTEKTRGGDYQYGLDTMFEKREAYYLREEASTDKKSQQ